MFQVSYHLFESYAPHRYILEKSIKCIMMQLVLVGNCVVDNYSLLDKRFKYSPQCNADVRGAS